jgi:hypothetical protein
MPSMGGGAADGLRDVLARLFFEAQQKQQMRNQEQQRELQARGLDLQERNATATEGFRRDTLDATKANQTAMNEDRDASRDVASEARLHGRLQLMPKGTAIDSPDMIVEMAKRGLGGMMKPVPNEPRFQFSGTQATANAEATANAADTRADEVARHNREMERLAAARGAGGDTRERIVQVQGPNGAPIWVRESEAVGKPAAQAARAVTGQERGVLAYYNRAKDASDTITTPDPSGQALEDRVAKGGIGTQLGLQYAPNMLQSSDQQAYRQAQRTFTEARLRKESGAAIPTGEYENDARTYFAQPGDTPQTIDLKRQKRQTVLEGLKFSSGKAFDEFYGGDGQAKPTEGGAPKGVKVTSIKQIQ